MATRKKASAAAANPPKRRRKAPAKRRAVKRPVRRKVAAANPPKKRTYRKRRAAKNPPAFEVQVALGRAGSAMLGGAIALGASAVIHRVVPEGARDLVGIITPVAVGLIGMNGTLQHSADFAAGAFGVAGLRAAGALVDLVKAAKNPPLPPSYYFESHNQPPLLNPPSAALLGAVPSIETTDARDAALTRLLASS